MIRNRRLPILLKATLLKRPQMMSYGPRELSCLRFCLRTYRTVRTLPVNRYLLAGLHYLRQFSAAPEYYLGLLV